MKDEPEISDTPGPGVVSKPEPGVLGDSAGKGAASAIISRCATPGNRVLESLTGASLRPTGRLEVHHRVALVHGGADALSNLMLLSHDCFGRATQR